MSKKRFERPIIKKVNAGVPDKFGLSNKLESITQIDGIDLSEITEKYGSPCFVVSEQTLRRTYRQAYTAFSTAYPKVQFAWSYKTNYLDAVCNIFHQEGSWAEVVSGFEYDKALANGVEGSKIIFNGPAKTEAELTKAIQNKSLILQMLTDLADQLKERPCVAIRINMDVGIYPKWDRFGFNYEKGEAWEAISLIMDQGKLDLLGLHTHVGTFMLETNAYKVAASKLAHLMKEIQLKYDHTLTYLDLGGGFASRNTLKDPYLASKTIPTFDEYAEAITSIILNSGIEEEKLPTLILETGRALVDDAGYLVGQVLSEKRLSSGAAALVLDIGVHYLFTSFWFDHNIHPGVETASEDLEETTLFGPLCMNIDVIRRHMLFPPLKRGDHVVVKRIGAYSMTQWMQFITYRPSIVLIDEKGEMHVIRKAESLETFKAQEQTPKHLENPTG
jgi:diaminopimelate decarboxylase